MKFVDSEHRKRLTEWFTHQRQVLLRSLDFSPRALILHGSHAVGFANKGSDLDILAVTDSLLHTQALKIAPFTLHVQFVPFSNLMAGIKNMDNEYQQRVFDLNFTAARLKDSLILYDPFGLARQLVSAAEAYVPSKKTLQKFRLQALGAYVDALGAFEAQDYVSSSIMVRLGTFGLSARVLLEHGVTDLNVKWHLRRLERIFGEDSFINLYKKIWDVNKITQKRALQDLKYFKELYDNYKNL